LVDITMGLMTVKHPTIAAIRVNLMIMK